MTLETSIQNLADAINNLASTLAANPPLPQNLEATPTSAAVATRRRGRPPKAETVEVIESPEVPAAIEPEPAPVAPPPATAPAIAKADVQKLLIEVVQRVGRDKCGELCRAHGGPNLSALDPSVYPALVADARKALEDAASDPAA